MAISVIVTSSKNNQILEEKEFIFSGEDFSIIDLDYISNNVRNNGLIFQKDMDDDENSLSRLCELYKYLVAVKENGSNFSMSLRYNGFEQFVSEDIKNFNYVISKSEIKSGLMERLTISL